MLYGGKLVETTSFNKFIGNRLFRIPIYQRHYSWDNKQLDDLWNDLLYLDPNKKHYFGTILTKNTEETAKPDRAKEFEIHEIIDGQQRFATVLVFLREILTQLRQTGFLPEEDVGRLEEEYLKYKSAYKLELLGDDQEFFRRYIVDGREYPEELITQSRMKLKNARDFFREKLNGLKQANAETFPDTLLQFKKRIDDMELIEYEIQNDPDAARIFETVNDRGKPLSNLEKTKSFMMYMMYLSKPEDCGDELRRINENFSNIFRLFTQITDKEPGRYLEEDDIQRYHFVIYEKDIVHSRRDEAADYLPFLKNKFRRIYRERRTGSPGEMLSYVQDLENSFYSLKTLLTYGEDDAIAALLERLFILGRVANFYPLLIASWIEFERDRSKLERILSLIETITFRTYAIRGRRADTGQSRLYDLSFQVHTGTSGYDKIVAELQDIVKEYCDDANFRSALSSPEYYLTIDNLDQRFLLFEYEKFLRESSKEPLDIKLKEILKDSFTIEHIWPSDPSQLNLSAQESVKHQANKHRLGNLTLASRSWNSSWGNSPFQIKRREYNQSVLRVQKELTSFTTWGTAEIDQREKRLIEFAVNRWKY